MCFTNAIGMFDLSCASAMIIAAMMEVLSETQWKNTGLIIGCIAVGVVLGVINGTVSLLKIPCLIVSLGLLLIYEIFTENRSRRQQDNCRLMSALSANSPIV